jgi:hypothetical protein
MNEEYSPSGVRYQPAPLRDKSPYPELEDFQDAEHTIYRAVLRCDNRFHVLRDWMQSLSPDMRAFAKHHAALRIEHERFDGWIRYIGALANPQMSLDRRLHFHPDLKDLIIQMLALLDYAISHSESGPHRLAVQSTAKTNFDSNCLQSPGTP